MREIKFRVWFVPTHEYKCDYADRYGHELEDIYCHIYTQEDLLDDTWVDTGDFEKIIFEQYTGLKDKNGKEIYEGDIMSDGNVVRFALDDEVGSCGCCYDAFFGSGFIVTTGVLPECLEVRGNIHENPELLGGSKDVSV